MAVAQPTYIAQDGIERTMDGELSRRTPGKATECDPPPLDKTGDSVRILGRDAVMAKLEEIDAACLPPRQALTNLRRHMDAVLHTIDKILNRK